MTEICKRILDSGYFSGRAFSAADERIYNIAKGIAGPGTAKTWRAMNTTHHITRAIRDIGSVKGLQFADQKADGPVEQVDMFEQAPATN